MTARCDWSDLPADQCACHRCKPQARETVDQGRWMNCRHVSKGRPRVLLDRHDDACLGAGPYWHAPLSWVDCAGCQECTEPHCVMCGKAHSDGACPECLGKVRADLDAIADLVTGLPDEAVDKGVDSEAMMLMGPAADPRTWHNYADTAARGLLCGCMRRGEICPRERGRVCPDVAAYLEDCKDELHPLWVLGTWEQVWRDYLDHHTEALVDLEAAIGYLDMQMSYMSGQPMPDFVQFANELRACRTHLEDVLRDGVREERGAPCIHCQRPMIRLATETGTEDSYTCRTCRRTMEGDDYRYVVGVVHKVHADRLTADDLAERLGVTVSRIRVWGSRGYVKKHGKNADGKTLYDVADAQSRVESEPLEEAG